MLGQVVPLAIPLPGRAPVAEASAVSGGSHEPVRRALPIARGYCRPLGATPLGSGVNFAIFSRHATALHLVLFREGQEEPLAEIALDPAVNRTGNIWHVFVGELPPDVLYGYRVNGPFNPRAGQRFNPRAILVDPYARALSGGQPWGAPPETPRNRPARLGRVVADDFDWEGDKPPSTPLSQTVIYELHVRGFTRHPSSGVQHPGTFLGLTEKIPHLKSLGVTAVQLMPILEFDEHDVAQRGPRGDRLKNYWGYATLSYFAPKAGYASRPAGQVRELKEMVKAFHKAGIEVILDVVYNHTAEGNENGPTLSFRGLDNSIYYLLDREGRYYNFSGCGNTLNCSHPLVRNLVLDSLVELVAEYHIDGFRFDLASILGRGPDGKVQDDPQLLKQIAEHPLLAGTKLLAEPWDAAGLSQLGKFPAWGHWTELNGHFRDDVRRFVRSEGGMTAALAKRLCGSLDLYGESARHLPRSINMVTCHDGFTLCDLVSYNHKHNWANGEDNRDGWDHNFSYNCGVEGPTDSAAVQGLRQRQMRNFLALLMVAQGVPLLTMGDEFARTQQGNNNAYCQDNEVSWVDWNLAQKNAGLLRFTSMLIELRKKYFALSRDEFIHHISWHGTRLGQPDWTGQSRTLALQLAPWHGRPAFYLMFNAHWEAQRFALPAWRWRRLVDTNLASPDDVVEEGRAVHLSPGDHYIVSPRSVVILLG
jgi:glycogen operon protein